MEAECRVQNIVQTGLRTLEDSSLELDASVHRFVYHSQMVLSHCALLGAFLMTTCSGGGVSRGIAPMASKISGRIIPG